MDKMKAPKIEMSPFEMPKIELPQMPYVSDIVSEKPKVKNLIIKDDIRDELVVPAVDDMDFVELREYVEDLVFNIANLTLEELPQMPYKLKELQIAYVCKLVCLHKSFSATLSTRNADSTDDSWSRKLKYYTALVSSLESGITEEILLGNASSSYGTVEILRC